MKLSPHWRRGLLVAAVALVLLVVGGAFFVWSKFFREEPEQAFANDVERFKYGSVGGEAEAGLPYWIWIVLPRIFPEYLPGPGGYRSLGVTWEEGRELPVGFTKRVIGFPRVGNNCALCHAGTYRTKTDEIATVVPGAPTHSLNIQGMFAFLFQAAKDPRFNGGTIMAEINQLTELSVIDKLLYRFAIIPVVRQKILEQAKLGAWMLDPHRPVWGPGRDDAFNLAKYFVARWPIDDTSGQCDFNSVWNLKIRDGPGKLFNWAGETPVLHSVVVDSALGVGAQPGRAGSPSRRVGAVLICAPAAEVPVPRRRCSRCCRREDLRGAMRRVSRSRWIADEPRGGS